jgi:hypothetical protein
MASMFSPDELLNMGARYKGEVEMVSKWIGWVIRKMKDVAIYDDCLIIFTSDHGIYLGEHNRTGKVNISDSDPRGPWPLYDEAIHVPLIIKMPENLYAGTKIDEIVQPVDILPTILDLAVIDAGQALPGKSKLPDREIIAEMPGVKYGRENGLGRFHGQTILDIFNRGKWPRKFAFSCPQLGPLTAESTFGAKNPEVEGPTLFWMTLHGLNHSLVLGGNNTDSPELYDMSVDPSQLNNIYEKDHPLVQELIVAFLNFLNSVNADPKHIDMIKNEISWT